MLQNSGYLRANNPTAANLCEEIHLVQFSHPAQVEIWMSLSECALELKPGVLFMFSVACLHHGQAGSSRGFHVRSIEITNNIA
eukprot:2594517-Amphidinium_carterae.1